MIYWIDTRYIDNGKIIELDWKEEYRLVYPPRLCAAISGKGCNQKWSYFQLDWLFSPLPWTKVMGGTYLRLPHAGFCSTSANTLANSIQSTLLDFLSIWSSRVSERECNSKCSLWATYYNKIKQVHVHHIIMEFIVWDSSAATTIVMAACLQNGRETSLPQAATYLFIYLTGLMFQKIQLVWWLLH